MFLLLFWFGVSIQTAYILSGSESIQPIHLLSNQLMLNDLRLLSKTTKELQFVSKFNIITFNSGNTIFIQNVSKLNLEIIVYILLGHIPKKCYLCGKWYNCSSGWIICKAYNVETSTKKKESVEELLLEIKLNKRQKKILTWIVVWAGLLIVVLYSPVGSPGLYSSQNDYVDNLSVPLQSGATIHLSKGTSSSEDDDNGSFLPDITTTPATNNSTGNYQSANPSTGGSSYSSQQSTYQNTNTSSSGASGGAGVSIIASGSSRSSNGTSGIAMTNGIASISTTNLSTTNTTTKQSSSSSTTATGGGTDPGFDPTNGPIPVGDGWWALLMFGGIYVVLKRRFTSQKKA